MDKAMIDPRIELLSDALNVSMATIQDAINDDEEAHARVISRILKDVKNNPNQGTINQ